MVDADDGGAHEFGSEYAEHADGAWGGDVDDMGSELIGGTKHGDEWGEGEVECFVAGHFHCEDGRKVDEVVAIGHVHACGGEDLEIAVGVVCGLGGVLDESTYAVDVGEGVGELEYAGGVVVEGHVVGV